MTTFTFVFVFVLFALQGSLGVGSVSTAAKQFNDNVDEVLARHNVKALTIKMKEDIEKLLQTSEKNERLCGPKIRPVVERITKESEVETELCVARTNVTLLTQTEALKELDLCMSRVENKVSLEEHIIDYALNKCIDNVALLLAKSLPNSVDEVLARHNVKALTLKMKEDIEKLLQTSEKNERLCGPKIRQVVEHITKESEVETELCVGKMNVTLLTQTEALKELDLCMSRVENKISFEGHAILDYLNKCIDNVALLLAKSLPNSVDEVLARHNVKALTIKMKEDIEKLLQTSEKNERLCGPKIRPVVERITKESEVETELCVARTNVTLLTQTEALKELDLCMSRVENKVTFEEHIIDYALNKCIDNVALLH